MPRFLFDTGDGDHSVQDRAGYELAGREEARRMALDALPDMARARMPGGDGETFICTVRDEGGVPIFTATLSLAARWLNQAEEPPCVPSNDPRILKLAHAVDLTGEDRAELQRITAHPRAVAPRTDLIREGDRPDTVRLVTRGLACRYQDLPDGGRAIIALLIPGDFCDLHVAILGAMDHSIATLSACDVVEIPRATIRRIADTNPRITHALWWATLVDEGVLRHWLISQSRRKADLRLLHLLCELHIRYRAVGLADGDSYPFPVTQQELGDILGLSEVHTHRTLQALRAEGLVAFEDGRVTLLDRERAWAATAFDGGYLHLRRRVPA